MDEKRNYLISTLRWIAVLPAAILVPLIVCLLLAVLALIGDFLSGDLRTYLQHPEILPIEHLFMSFIIAGIFGYLFTVAGAKCAPNYQKIVAFVLFAIIAIIVGFFLIFSLLITDISESWRFVINCIVCILSAGAGAFFFEED